MKTRSVYPHQSTVLVVARVHDLLLLTIPSRRLFGPAIGKMGHLKYQSAFERGLSFGARIGYP